VGLLATQLKKKRERIHQSISFVKGGKGKEEPHFRGVPFPDQNSEKKGKRKRTIHITLRKKERNLKNGSLPLQGNKKTFYSIQKKRKKG